jgi:hypothetical protein
MEWLFFVTKPSFMSGMSIGREIGILMLSALGLGFFPLLFVFLLGVADRSFQNKAETRFLLAIGSTVPTLILSTLVLLLIDNFTYTVFRVGVVSTERFPRAGYALLFIGIAACIYGWITRYVHTRSRKKYPVRTIQWILIFLLLLSSVVLSTLTRLNSRATIQLNSSLNQAENLPNIILLGSDGLDATRMSAYGYERDTTPHIRARLSDAMVAENAFPNGGTTAGSIASIMTGKLPIEIGVIYPPDFLQGENSYQHLPGILQRLGYHTVDLSVPYFGDAITLNMQGGFDVANGRSGADHPVVGVTRWFAGGDSAYLVDMLLQRALDRLLHIFFIKPMINPYENVIQPTSREDEQKRFSDLISALEENEPPVFVHVHMLGTHGPRFEIRKQVFSSGQTQDQDWMLDFYDDAIVNFDQYVGELFEYLSQSGTLENTLLIVYSDHGKQWTVQERVPLFFWFPDKEHTGRIDGNVQNVDIAPTILDYLNVPIPEWMVGQSLLSERLSQEYIFSASVDTSQIEVSKDGLWVVESGRRKPPFFQLGFTGLVACDHWFELYVQPPRILYGEVQGHVGTCDPGLELTPEKARQLLVNHLLQNGYDISTLPSTLPVQFVE